MQMKQAFFAQLPGMCLQCHECQLMQKVFGNVVRAMELYVHTPTPTSWKQLPLPRQRQGSGNGSCCSAHGTCCIWALRATRLGSGNLGNAIIYHQSPQQKDHLSHTSSIPP
mmetsp:Transcript_72484/g.143700  ORF Transcript_72484/g.143700 Transcript_72484/m.143700 type:complete len:111 (+) Transcript_72484:64-396(+)